MEKAVAHFKRLHPTRIELLRVIVVNKDLNEIKILESKFAKARVLVWHFHVIKYLQEKRAKLGYAILSHFNNNTNNRLESFFGKLKDSADGKMSMTGCVKALLAFDMHNENEYRYRLDRIGRQVNSNYDEEMANVLRFTSHFVAEEIAEQYIKALANNGQYQFTGRWSSCGKGDR
ncbi:hypothetical protein PHMEG_0007176 [Phytophthora megakarya]|uniref:MULE transposase domain-containing protein n=1 Tax=Phytophthora megakarya TaxID=4795 RepID=A0A225WP08_9STRA|nr:hypothetical protein PHMEG_0007176 [Phytophthora megakarya]